MQWVRMVFIKMINIITAYVISFLKHGLHKIGKQNLLLLLKKFTGDYSCQKILRNCFNNLLL